MGTDWVSLFNRRRCYEVLNLNLTSMGGFVEPHLLGLNGLSEFKCGFDEGVPVLSRIAQLQARGRSEEELKADQVEYLCVFPKRITLDYWACYVEVFNRR
jgi:hypothetical protein